MTVQEIEAAIRQLSPQDRAILCARLEEEAAACDKQIEADIQAGKLDWLAEEARRELEAGRCTDL
jgi:hypothetical protein